MWRVTLSRIFVTATAVTVWSCASPGPGRGGGGITIDEKAAGSTVTLHVGESLTVTLPGNPTTGYLWRVEPGTEQILAQQGEPRFEPIGQGLGAGGTLTFVFKGIARGTAVLRLRYARPFPSAAPSDKSLEVTVTVTE